ncbi:MAG: rod shape-determining protein MreC [Tissierellia bacterium]|nr:rod shape-determining protein MreC [Tissierellia bacterium]
MSFFRRNKWKILTFLIIVSLFILIFISTKRSKTSTIEGFFGDLISPGNKFFYTIGSFIGDKLSSVGDYFSLQEENEKLKEEIIKLKEENLKMEKTIASQKMLENEYKLEEKIKYSYIKADIIGMNTDNWFNIYTIDKGEKDGIKENQTVISAIETETGFVKEGLVGKVVEIGSNWSKVETIINDQNSISFQVTSSLDGGVLAGEGAENLKGYMFDGKANPGIGDRVITSGLGGIYMPGIFIGHISLVEESPDNLIKKIEVSPSVDFKKLYSVYVLTGRK